MSSEWKNWICSNEKEDVECAFLSNQFWKSLTLIVKVTKPIFNLMRLVDSQKPTTGKFYEYCEMDGLTSENQKRNCYYNK